MLQTDEAGDDVEFGAVGDLHDAGAELCPYTVMQGIPCADSIERGNAERDVIAAGAQRPLRTRLLLIGV